MHMKVNSLVLKIGACSSGRNLAFGMMAMMLGLSLVACGGGAASGATASTGSQESVAAERQPDVTEIQGAASESAAEVNLAEPSLGSLMSHFREGDDEGNPCADIQVLRKIFTVSIDGVTYELPCPAQSLVEDGWDLAVGQTVNDLEPGSGLSGIPLRRGGTGEAMITIDVINMGDAVCSWQDAKLIGVNVYSSEPVAIESAVGFGLGDSFLAAYELVGSNSNSYTDSAGTHHAQLNLYTLDDDLAGYLEYYCTPEGDEVSHIRLSLSTVGSNPLLVGE